VNSFYRKYRPKKFSEIFGHEINAEILKNSAILDRLNHAYLFYGERGTGKTTTARILAKVANCQTRQSDLKFKEQGEPCNSCQACLNIDSGLSLDVVEIDAASNRGIDEIRNLKESVRLTPSFLKYKTYIIDEVHMLTSPAWNALLKTLEEPPAHALFILATTEIDKVPTTIKSRVQKFLFGKLPKPLIIKKLENISSAEKIDIEQKALEFIAGLSEGSLRDAENLFDQIHSFSGQEKISLSKVESILGKASLEKINSLLSLVFKKDPTLLEKINLLKNESCDIVQFNKDSISYLGKLLSLKTNPKMEIIFKNTFSDNELEEMKTLISQFSLNDGLKLIKSLIEAHREMRYSPFAWVPFEVALIEFIKEKDLLN